MANEKMTAKKPNVVRTMALIAIFTAVMCVLSPLSIPLEPVSITLATLALYVIGALLPFPISIFPILIYLCLGFVGLPIFSKFQGGPQVILGPTGGFLIGYLPCVAIESLLISFFPNKKWMYPLAMLLGTIVLYSIGLLWIVFYGGYAWKNAWSLCVLPFLPGDFAKIIVSTIVGVRLRPLVAKKK